MNQLQLKIAFIFVILILTVACNSQVDNTRVEYNNAVNRNAVVAGQFYPSSAQELDQELTDLFSSVGKRDINNIYAVIVPHAGYVYSGKVASAAYGQLDQHYENIFIIASSHTAYFKGASIYEPGNYVTPLGEVKINHEIANQLRSSSKLVNYIPSAHTKEHSLEVQLPFLQHVFGQNLSIIPIIIGSNTSQECKSLAEIFSPYFNQNNLFVISSDFSHYPSYEEANLWDGQTADAIISRSPQDFLDEINSTEDDNVNNLRTRCCGWSSILTLLYMIDESDDYAIEKVMYENSGDSKHGDKNRVVGYNSFVISTPQIESTNNFILSDTEKDLLLKAARKSLSSYLTSGVPPGDKIASVPEKLKLSCGAFVTLNKNHRLRGCIGQFSSDKPLISLVQEMAIAAGTKDSRFPTVTVDELEEIEFEISVLTPLTRIDSVEQIQMGRHGIYIKNGYRTGTFLPQVAQETGWTKEEFLGHCSRDKAGIGWDGWKSAEIYIYEAIVFSESR